MMTALPLPTQRTHRTLILCITVVAVALLVSACGGGDDDGGGSYEAAAGASTPNATTGQALYNNYCLRCHKSSFPNARNAPSTLSAIATNRGGMGSLTNIQAQQATDIAYYLAYGVTAATTAATTTSTTTAGGSVTTTTVKTTTTTTTSAAADGKIAYASNSVRGCGPGCHGTPPSSNKVLNGANNPSIIQNAINSGSGGMGMYSGKLTARQISDIAAYLATPNI